jgi:hypothetical protein
MHRRYLLAGLFLALILPARAADVWQLVTPEEVARDAAGNHMAMPGLRALPQPGAPTIVVEQPGTAAKLHPPVTFLIRFVPEAGTAINTDSFHAKYGWLGIDITSRLLQHARLVGQTLQADNVAIPAGDHKVTLEIADFRGRVASQTFNFTVE